MSEQVSPAPKAYQANVFWDRHDCATLSAQVYLASDADSYIDALQAEAEALRVALLGIASVNPSDRGIEWAKSYASDGLKGSGSELYARWLDTFKEAEALRAENAKLRTAQAEHGERQEAVAWGAFHFGGKRNGKLYAHCETEEQVESYIADLHRSNDSITLRKGPLYTSPQPGPDVRALVEAAQQADDVLSAIVRNDQPIETLKREYGEEWSSAIDTVRASLVTQIAGHRQEQPQ